MQKLDTKVLIVGAGPCGVTIANFMGLYGVDAILIDRASDILDYPRAVGIDDEVHARLSGARPRGRDFR